MQEAWVYTVGLGWGRLPPTPDKACRTVQGSLPLHSPSPAPPLHGIPSGQGLCRPPHGSRWGAPSPNSAFLNRRTFVWGLDGEQGAFEWLAEDWGHGEGQGQERGGSVLATSWTPGDPQHHSRGGEEGCRSQARESTIGRIAKRTEKGGLEVKALLGAICWGQGEWTPHLQQGWTGMLTQLLDFFMWLPQAISQSQALD